MSKIKDKFKNRMTALDILALTEELKTQLVGSRYSFFPKWRI